MWTGDRLERPPYLVAGVVQTENNPTRLVRAVDCLRLEGDIDWTNGIRRVGCNEGPGFGDPTINADVRSAFVAKGPKPAHVLNAFDNRLMSFFKTNKESCVRDVLVFRMSGDDIPAGRARFLDRIVIDVSATGYAFSAGPDVEVRVIAMAPALSSALSLDWSDILGPAREYPWDTYWDGYLAYTVGSGSYVDILASNSLRLKCLYWNPEWWWDYDYEFWSRPFVHSGFSMDILVGLEFRTHGGGAGVEVNFANPVFGLNFRVLDVLVYWREEGGVGLKSCPE